MAKEKSQYEPHKKYHDLVGRLQDLSDDKHSTGLASHVHKIASDYLHKNKGIDGKLEWKDDESHKKFSDSLWDAAANKIAKDYLNKSDAWIKEMKGAKTPDGTSQWEEFIATYLGGMKKDDFFDRVKDEGELTIQNILSTYVNTISQRHIQYRHTSLLKNHINKPEDQQGVAGYLGMAKKHNKKAMKPMKVPKNFKSLEDAMNSLAKASQYLPDNYHPDKKDTYSK